MTIRGLLVGPALVFGLAPFAPAGIGPVPMAAVMADRTLFFVLDKPREIGFLRVSEFIDKTKTGAAKWHPSNLRALWILGYDSTISIKKRKYLKLGQVAYGQKFEEFPWVVGPTDLQRNVEYLVEISMGNKFAKETFTLSDRDGVVTTGSESAREGSYSISLDSNGRKILIPTPEVK